MTMNRRALLGSLAPLTLGGGLLAACAGITSPDQMDKLAAKIVAVDQMFQAMLPQIALIPGMNAAELARIAGYADQVTALAAQIAKAADLNAAKPMAVQVVAYANAILSEVGKYPVSPALRTTLAMIQGALPVIVALLP